MSAEEREAAREAELFAVAEADREVLAPLARRLIAQTHGSWALDLLDRWRGRSVNLALFWWHPTEAEIDACALRDGDRAVLAGLTGKYAFVRCADGRFVYDGLVGEEL